MADYLKANGYTVRKARKVAAADDGPRSCIHCGAPSRHLTYIGGKKKADKRPVRLCSDCYRFGPHKTALALVPADPARAVRLYHVWQRAHNRWAHHLRSGYASFHARRRVDSLLKAMTNQKMERAYVPTDMFGRLIGGAA
jgi:hypothetical protein